VWRDHPDATALIVGNEPPAEVRALADADPRVLVTGFVPELEPWYARSRVSLSPLRYGAGVKGKIVGAMQQGLPVVTTACGNEGIQLRNGVEALIADDAAGLAAAVSALLSDPDRCRDLAVAGAAVVRERFSAERARSVLLALLGDTLCPCCGTRPREPRTAPGTPWGDNLACTGCGATNRDAASAEVILRPFRARRVNSLREARPLLAELRIRVLSDAAALAAELPPSPAADPDPSARPDLIVGHLPAGQVVSTLAPGGRHVVALPADAGPADVDRLADAAEAAGLLVRRHDISRVAGRHVLVLEATRP
ncbi:MAG: glycosyltransferase, partial [Gluconacetobacter diazotrophicus]|nr:glycosyltransferase [Gluconacetobacter diazotrophicus]